MIPLSSSGPTPHKLQPATCLACGEPLRGCCAPIVAGDAVCSSPHCRLVASRRDAMAPAAFQRLIEVHRRQLREQQARIDAAARSLAERREMEVREQRAIREAVCRDEALAEAQYPLAVIPTGLQPLEPLLEERRASYRTHLESIVAAALGTSVDEADDRGECAQPDDDGPAALTALLCTQCAGACCSKGANRGYLQAATIRRVLRTHPDWDPGQLVDRYLDRLPDETMAGSCINHSSTGCSLPRDMRSDTCNDYYCGTLRNWRARCATGPGPHGALVVQRECDNWSQDRGDVPNAVTGVYLITATGTRRMVWPPR